MYYDAEVDTVMYYNGSHWCAIISDVSPDWTWESQGPDEWIVKILSEAWYETNKFEVNEFVVTTFSDLNGFRFLMLKDSKSATFFELKYS